MREKYSPAKIERKWQKFWEKSGLFRMDVASSKPKYYCLMMYPYPSASLHVGHGRNYIIGDVVARYKIMQGFNVLTPMGWDAFGLPAENAAIQGGLHPKISTLNNIKKMKQQLKEWGVGYDWDREITSCLSDYYKWTQWIFLKLFDLGLAYKKQAAVNWCPSCKTVLANEQVIGGKCERCDSEVAEKELEQWFFKISAHAQRLLDDLQLLERWPERVKLMQANWIGRSSGVQIEFPVVKSKKALSCFTTRVDTIFGATYMVLAPEHSYLGELIKSSPKRSEILAFIEKTKKESKIERSSAEVEKVGMDTGRRCLNPVNGGEIPIFVANYILAEYGTGAVMAVPAHDQRDFEFAKKYKLPIRVVIDNPKEHLDAETMKEAYVEEGVMVSSGEFDGIGSRQAMRKIAEWMEKRKIGKCTVHYRLRDWLISRQRYWGAPIPIIHCDKCGTVAVPEKNLPVKLPENVEFKPTGESPLRAVKKFVEVKCPKCHAQARRETDTMDTFVDSSWYFLRYLSPKDAQRPFDKRVVDEWLPVDQYIGGVEHAIMHLLYARFITKVLYDLDAISFSEPFARLFTQGMIIKDGAKMSKSKGNVVAPDELIKKYGADTVRLYTLFIAPPEKDAEWNDRAVEGAYRFLNRVWNKTQEFKENFSDTPARAIKLADLTASQEQLYRKIHQTIKKVTEDIEESFHFNTAIASIMELVNEICAYKVSSPGDTAGIEVLREALEKTAVLLSPFVPHIAEEIWKSLGNSPSIFSSPWPKCNAEALVEERVTIPIQINGKLRSRIDVPVDIVEEDLKNLVLQDEKVKKWIEGKEVKNFIIVPKRLANLVTK